MAINYNHLHSRSYGKQRPPSTSSLCRTAPVISLYHRWHCITFSNFRTSQNRGYHWRGKDHWRRPDACSYLLCRWRWPGLDGRRSYLCFCILHCNYIWRNPFGWLELPLSVLYRKRYLARCLYHHHGGGGSWVCCDYFWCDKDLLYQKQSILLYTKHIHFILVIPVNLYIPPHATCTLGWGTIFTERRSTHTRSVGCSPMDIVYTPCMIW